jgi:phospholipid/cholesterol/gamma-HCH transport system ATP-binding protein
MDYEHGEKKVIVVDNIYKKFGDLQVLKGLSLTVHKGETLVVIGESGCGKSILLKHIIGIVKPDSGRVMFDGNVISEMSERELARTRIRFGMVFQGSALFDSLSVEENVAFGLTEHSDKSAREIAEIVRSKLSLVGLSGAEEKFPAELSGGMKKRVALARAIALEPEVILYDEPTTGLDPIMADVINELIVRLSKTLGVTSVAVTHDMKSACKIGHEIAMLHGGKIIAEGTPNDIMNSRHEIVSQFVRGEARHRMEERKEKP